MIHAISIMLLFLRKSIYDVTLDALLYLVKFFWKDRTLLRLCCLGEAPRAQSLDERLAASLYCGVGFTYTLNVVIFKQAELLLKP